MSKYSALLGHMCSYFCNFFLLKRVFFTYSAFSVKMSLFISYEEAPKYHLLKQFNYQHAQLFKDISFFFPLMFIIYTF